MARVRPSGFLQTNPQDLLASVSPGLVQPWGGVTVHLALLCKVYLVHVDKEEDEQNQLCQQDDQQHDEELER